MFEFTEEQIENILRPKYFTIKENSGGQMLIGVYLKEPSEFLVYFEFYKLTWHKMQYDINDMLYHLEEGDVICKESLIEISNILGAFVRKTKIDRILE